MPTLILTPRYTEDSQLLWKAATGRGWKVERLTSWRLPDHLQTVREPVLYAEALIGPVLAEQLGITLLNPPDDWLVHLPLEYRRRHIALSTLREARINQEITFVKPPNDKSFPAGVYRGNELPLEYPDDMPVLVSDVVKWTVEFRCFILDRSLRTYSIYARNGNICEFVSTPEENEQLEKFLSLLLTDSRVELPQATVVDVGYIAGAGWACIEQNAAWGAGIYGCEPATVLDVIQYASRKTTIAK